METTPRWLTEKQVFKMTGRAEQTLRNDRCKGKGIPYCKVGASIRYRLDDVVTFMDEHRIVPGRPASA